MPLLANNEDLSSQLGHIIIQTEKSGRLNVLSFVSYKSKCVVRSVVGAKTYDFADCFDQFYTIYDEY